MLVDAGADTCTKFRYQSLREYAAFLRPVTLTFRVPDASVMGRTPN